jgi:hypothetical protein
VEGGEGQLPAEPASALEIVTGLVQEFNAANHVKWRLKPPDPSLRHPPLVALAFRLAMTMVLENSYKAASDSQRFEVVLHNYGRRLGGRRFLSVQVENALKKRLKPEIVRQLYRVPLSGKDKRLHLGAFAAGAAMRAVGGDVYLSKNTVSEIATTIDIPLEELYEGI